MSLFPAGDLHCPITAHIFLMQLSQPGYLQIMYATIRKTIYNIPHLLRLHQHLILEDFHKHQVDHFELLNVKACALTEISTSHEKNKLCIYVIFNNISITA